MLPSFLQVVSGNPFFFKIVDTRLRGYDEMCVARVNDYAVTRKSDRLLELTAILESRHCYRNVYGVDFYKVVVGILSTAFVSNLIVE